MKYLATVRLFMPLNDKDPRYWLEIAGLDEMSAEILRREGGPASIGSEKTR
jgi:hypothetical protein